MKLVHVSLVLVGAALGCAAALARPKLMPNARASAGWNCYVADRLPDTAEAAAWSGARDLTQGMNKIAADTPSGTVVTVTPRSGNTVSVICVKH